MSGNDCSICLTVIENEELELDLSFGLPSKGIHDIYDLEAKTQNTLIGSEDNIEGVTAFMEKRKPNFS